MWKNIRWKVKRILLGHDRFTHGFSDSDAIILEPHGEGLLGLVWRCLKYLAKLAGKLIAKIFDNALSSAVVFMVGYILGKYLK